MNKFLFLSLVSTFLLLGCSDDSEPENCLSYKHAKISSVNTEVLIVNKNVELPITINYLVDNSCGIFDSFEVDRDNKNYQIKLKTKYEGCVCNEIASELQTIYHFRSSESGFYTLNFSVSNTEYVTMIIEVI